MNTGRITTNYQFSQTMLYMQSNLNSLTQIQERIASGKNLQRSSDNPIDFSRLMNVSTSINQDARYIRNIQTAKAEVEMTDTAITQMTELINRAKEITLQAASDTANATNREAIATEISSIMDQLVQIGNTQVNGKFIFGGLETNTAPFNRTGNTTVTYSGTGTASNPNTERRVEISQKTTVPINVSGLTLFGQVAPNGAPPPNTTGSGILQSLGELMTNLQANDAEAIRARLSELDTHLETALGEQARMGVTLNQMDLTLNRLEERNLTFSEEYAGIQSVDLAKAISALNFQETAYQASIGVAGRVLQTSLLNFLR